MGAGSFNGVNYNGQHTGTGWFKYNLDALPGHQATLVKNKHLTEGTEVTYVGKDHKFKNRSGVILKHNSKYGRGYVPVRISTYDKKNSLTIEKVVMCHRSQLRFPMTIIDKHNESVNVIKAKRELRKRKKDNYRKQRQASK
jgi:hypothetical protein